jgi:hypothetical protein
MRDLFNPNAPEQARLNLSAGPIEKQFTDRYRPASLDEIVGQDDIVAALRTFVESPYPTAFLFHGPTGTGKTSAAFALASELRVDFAANWHYVKSGTANAETVEDIIDGFRLTPWGSSKAWRIVLVDEADQCTAKAKQLWLSALESIPQRTIVIFTTNHVDRFEQRDLDRFQHAGFCFGGSDLDGAQRLVDRIWQAETGASDGPDLSQLPNVVLDGVVSYRRVAMAVQAAVRDGLIVARASTPLPTVFLEEATDVDRASVSLPDMRNPSEVLEHSNGLPGPMSELQDERTGTADDGTSNDGMESSERATYPDGRTIPIVGDDAHCAVGEGFVISGRVIERDGATWVRLESGDCLPIDEDWSVSGEDKSPEPAVAVATFDAITPLPDFSGIPALCGGSPEPEPTTITIQGVVYSVEMMTDSLDQPMVRICKSGRSNACYDVTSTIDRGITCTCPDYTRRHAQLEGQSEGCKHVKSMVAAGLVTRNQPAPVAEVPPTDPAVAAEMERIHAAVIDRIASGMDETGAVYLPMAERTLTLVEVIEQEATRLDGRWNDAGRLMAQALRDLADDVRFMRAETVSDYEARKELQDEWAKTA